MNLTDAEKLDWLRLIRTDHVGPVTFYRLVSRYGSAAKALEALPELQARGGKKSARIPSKADAERELQAIHKSGGQLISAQDEAYPLALSAIEDAPPLLTVLGNAALLNAPSIGIVGARNASLNGKKFTKKLAADLGRQGQCVVSGLARGIDTSAHEGALETGTIGVVAGGADVIYPTENTKLYHDIIAKGGAIVAESPWGTQPSAMLFPRRNRIVSGLSAGVVVVEATLRSGSLITARLAAEQGRDVFAVPGFPGDPRAEGPNALLRDGAVLVQKADDIISHLSSFVARGTQGKLLENMVQRDFVVEEMPLDPMPSDLSQKVIAALSHTATGVDEIVRTCHVSSAEVQAILLELELGGRVIRLPGNRVSLVE
ncbi:MAG: DNA-processing protein DprA [Pseudobdellovibrionaceae bacterium]